MTTGSRIERARLSYWCGGAALPTMAWPTGSFAGRLSSADLQALCGLGRSVRNRAGDLLAHEGQPADGVLLLRRGLVKVVLGDGHGHDHLLGVRGPGELLGELACISGEPHSATVTALSPLWSVKVAATAFTTFLLNRPAVAMQVACLIGGRLRAADRRRIELSSREVSLRLVRVLRDMVRTFQLGGAGPAPEIPLSQDELAQLINAAEVSVQRALRDLRGRRLVATGYRRVVVPCLTCLDQLLTDPADGREPAKAITGCGGLSVHHRR